MDNNYRFETNAIHAGQEPDKETGAVIPPIHLSSTFKQDGVGMHRGYEYSRTGNPTRNQYEELIARLEGGRYGLAFASGSAATAVVQMLLKEGDHVICGDDVYGGTFRFFDKVMKKFGVQYSFVDTTDPGNVERAIKDNTRMLWLETPTNPLLKITDLEAVSSIAREHNLISVVDNTFASPFNQSPLKYGADIVLHSSTKYIGGHSDLVGGVVVTSRDDLHEDLRFLQNASGAVPSPFDCWLAMRGVKTLPLRMERHSKNASLLAEFLAEREEVERVYYPFLEEHPSSDIARKQMKTGGGMISFDLKGGKKAAYQFLAELKLFTLAESLGGVESLCEYPPEMTHGSIPPEVQVEIGINPGLVRLSVGIEHVADLQEDLLNAFAALET